MRGSTRPPDVRCGMPLTEATATGRVRRDPKVIRYATEAIDCPIIMAVGTTTLSINLFSWMFSCITIWGESCITIWHVSCPEKETSWSTVQRGIMTIVGLHPDRSLRCLELLMEPRNSIHWLLTDLLPVFWRMHRISG